MDNSMYLSLSRQMTLRRELDIVANNIANADTAGFKMEELLVKTEAVGKARTSQVQGPVKFVIDDGITRDFGQGPLRKTGGSFDIAIEGQGFFTVQGPAGDPRYTRDGRLTLNPEGILVTQAGAPVLGQGNAQINIDPAQGEVSIGKDGTLTQTNPETGQATNVGRLAVVQFEDRSALSKEGDNLFRNTSNAQPIPAEDALVHQGMVEGSNVQQVVEITRLIEVTRAYERSSKLVDGNNDLSRRSIERLGRPN
ncbi:flagellar basal-body rod protein FlgF [Caulobacter segnis]|uniref:flagellar basal-body rod protein FlgF n=1 Tax=Caulobacter segnis TaxID=88688 RepID=UPI00240F19BB|nr:flagellar basal-body rod protein FlgF [Caulobacter segnis]MDG2522716.1 flagellar basal-body rod protein FlgF [Caulobacter segnis]